MSWSAERTHTAGCGCVIRLTIDVPTLSPDEVERGCHTDVDAEDVELTDVEIVEPCRAHAPIPVDQRVNDSPLTTYTPVNVMVTVDDCNHAMFRRTDLLHALLTRTGVPVRSVIVLNTEMGVASTTRDPTA